MSAVLSATERSQPNPSIFCTVYVANYMARRFIFHGNPWDLGVHGSCGPLSREAAASPARCHTPCPAPGSAAHPGLIGLVPWPDRPRPSDRPGRSAFPVAPVKFKVTE